MVQKEMKQGNILLLVNVICIIKHLEFLSTYFFKNILRGNLIYILCMNQSDLLCFMVLCPHYIAFAATDPSDLKHLKKTLYTTT